MARICLGAWPSYFRTKFWVDHHAETLAGATAGRVVTTFATDLLTQRGPDRRPGDKGKGSRLTTRLMIPGNVRHAIGIVGDAADGKAAPGGLYGTALQAAEEP